MEIVLKFHNHQMYSSHVFCFNFFFNYHYYYYYCLTVTGHFYFQKFGRKCSRHSCVSFDVDAPGGHRAPVLLSPLRGFAAALLYDAVEPESVNPLSTQTEPGGEHDRRSGAGVEETKTGPSR